MNRSYGIDLVHGLHVRMRLNNNKALCLYVVYVRVCQSQMCTRLYAFCVALSVCGSCLEGVF